MVLFQAVDILTLCLWEQIIFAFTSFGQYTIPLKLSSLKMIVVYPVGMTFGHSYVICFNAWVRLVSMHNMYSARPPCCILSSTWILVVSVYQI